MVADIIMAHCCWYCVCPSKRQTQTLGEINMNSRYRAHCSRAEQRWALRGLGELRRCHFCRWGTSGQSRTCDIDLKVEDRSIQAPSVAARDSRANDGPGITPRLHLDLTLMGT